MFLPPATSCVKVQQIMLITCTLFNEMIYFSSLIKVYQVLLVLFKKRVSQITNKSDKLLVKIYTFHVISQGEINFGK